MKNDIETSQSTSLILQTHSFYIICIVVNFIFGLQLVSKFTNIALGWEFRPHDWLESCFQYLYSDIFFYSIPLLATILYVVSTQNIRNTVGTSWTKIILAILLNAVLSTFGEVTINYIINLPPWFSIFDNWPFLILGSIQLIFFLITIYAHKAQNRRTKQITKNNFVSEILKYALIPLPFQFIIFRWIMILGS